MAASWKFTIPITCAVLIGGAAITLEIHRINMNHQMLANDAETCRVRAENGDAGAESSLGSFYYHGQGVPQDYAQAFLWYGKAANQNNANAQRSLGFMYQNGLGVSHDTSEALRWYRKAADQGDAKAQNALALIYSDGQGVPQDYVEAIRWYRKAVDQGYATAEYNLGNMYFYGRGVPRDRAEADRLYRLAALQGDEFAQRSLGLRGKGLSAWVVFSLFAMAIAWVLFLKDSLSNKSNPRTPHQWALIVGAALGLAYVGFSLMAAFGAFPSIVIANVVHFSRSFTLGIWVTVLISVAGPKNAKFMLLISIALLTLFNLFAVVAANRNPDVLTAADRLLWSGNGFLLGLLISSAIVIRLPIRKALGIAAK
jgi:Sel1 repeat